jgi:hypothetical protein
LKAQETKQSFVFPVPETSIVTNYEPGIDTRTATAGRQRYEFHGISAPDRTMHPHAITLTSPGALSEYHEFGCMSRIDVYDIMSRD